MNLKLEEALGRCLELLERGASIDQSLRGHEPLAAELRPLLAAAQTVRVRTIPDYTPQALVGGRARMHAACVVAAERAGTRSGGWLPWGRPLMLAGVSALVVVFAVLGFTTDLFRFGSDSSTAQAQGIVSSAGANEIVLTTEDGQLVIRIGENTALLDANGNVISGGQIVPGSKVKVEFEDDDGAFAGLKIEIDNNDNDDGMSGGSEVEFEGVVESIAGDTMTVQASFGLATVHLDAGTAVKGALAAGGSVKVHATLQDDGSYLAREVELTVAGDDTGLDDDIGPDPGDDTSAGDGSGTGTGDDTTDDDSSGSGDDTTDDSSGSGSGDDGSGDDDSDGPGRGRGRGHGDD